MTHDGDVERRGLRLHESGGETVSVVIYVNGIRNYSRSATLTGTGNGPRRYTLDDGTTRVHNRKLGYNELAKRLL